MVRDFISAGSASVLVAAFLSVNCFAQAPDSAELQRMIESYGSAGAAGGSMPNAEQLLEMQQQALEMQGCIAGIDHDALEKLRVEGEAVTREVQALCDAGKRNEAERAARAYGKRVVGSPAVAAIRKCGDMAAGMLSGLTAFVEGRESSSGDICSTR